MGALPAARCPQRPLPRCASFGPLSPASGGRVESTGSTTLVGRPLARFVELTRLEDLDLGAREQAADVSVARGAQRLLAHADGGELLEALGGDRLERAQVLLAEHVQRRLERERGRRAFAPVAAG